MAIERTPWFIAGGVEHSAELARILANAATSGATGVTYPSSFKVTAQDVPNGSVRVNSGVGPIASTYPGAAGQTYIVRSTGTTDVTIAPTGSASGRSDLIIVSVDDPQYVGTAPEDPNDYDYTKLEVISGVPSNTRDISQIELNRPAIALARIDIPSSTGTITQSMIKDLRKIALPKRERNMLTLYGSVRAGSTAHMVGDGYATWPIRESQRPKVFVPEWATHLQMNVTIAGAFYQEGSPVGETVYGFRVGLSGHTPAQNGILTIEDRQRVYMNVVGNIPISPSVRGTEQYLDVIATRTKGVGRLGSDFQTSIVLDFEWNEIVE